MEEEKSGEVMRVIDRGTGIEMVIPVEYYNPDVHDMPPDESEEPADEHAEEPVEEHAEEHTEDHGEEEGSGV